ncbi:uncharacterized protein LOC144942673 [Lampetra fluviatilis]
MLNNGSTVVSFKSGASVTVTAIMGALQFLISLPEKMRNNTQGLLGNSLPNITGSPVLETRLKEAKTIKFNITDLDGDNITLSISSTSPDINITADGVVVWLPTSSQAVFASVVASDGNRAPDGTLTPTLMPLNLALCNCSANSTCLFSEPMYSEQQNQSTFQVAGCNCSAGYTGQFCNENLNACTTNPCYPGIDCTDLPPPSLGYKCGPCPAGYTGDGENCLDIDECNVTSPCGGHGSCTNSPGSFNCSCFPGYRDPPTCRDIDECAENTSICNNATENCRNNEGNYSCFPRPGLQANGSVGWRPSSTREALVWLVASDGGSSSRVALSLTVCNCSRNAACNFSQPLLSSSNDSASFQVASCLCSSGYVGTYCDQDYDACGKSPCFSGVTCTDLPAPSLNFTCGPCPVGYSGNGRSCLDIDECNVTSPCGGHGSCTNSPGSFNCSCFPGYRNPPTCLDIDECAEQPNICSSSQLCVNTLGSFKCNCKLGVSDGSCSLVCPDSNCPESYCNKHGTCSLNTTTCKQQCACGDSYRGDNCQNGKEIFQAKLKVTGLNAIYRLNFTFQGETYDSYLTDSANPEYVTRRDSYIGAVKDRLSSISLFYDISLKRFLDQGNKVLLTEMTAKYNYTSTKDVIMFYDNSLTQTIRNSFNKRKRSTDVIYLDNLVEDLVVPKDVLLNYYSCDTELNGYVVVFDSAQGVICKSPCNNTNYCKNGGTCQHLAAGVQCT